jgi:hypothetical protein
MLVLLSERFLNERVLMNDFTMFAVFAGGVVAGLVAFSLFHIYRGLRDTLTNAKIGGVYNFEYVQPVTGLPERFMAKVLEVHRFSDDYISRLNSKSRYRKDDPNFERSRHLVTAQTPDGKIRNFYAERTRNVRRPLLGGVAFKTGLASLLF